MIAFSCAPIACPRFRWWQRRGTASRVTPSTVKARRIARCISPTCPRRCPTTSGLTFGSYTMVVEPVGTTFAALAQREHGRRVISVDPNVRPSVVSDMQVWASAAERFYRTATIIKASDEDIRVAWGGRLSIADAAAYWLNCGARLVVVTEGMKGATAFSAAGHVSVPGRAVVVRDTVGAGDTFHAALLAQLARTDRLDPADHRRARAVRDPRPARLCDGRRRDHGLAQRRGPADSSRGRREHEPCLPDSVTDATLHIEIETD